MMANRTWDEWIREYSTGHQSPVNSACHTIGISMIALAILPLSSILGRQQVWKVSAALFVVGWIFQFVGHAFEHKPPEFFKDWRFLFVGLRWWLAKLAGKASSF